MEHEIINYYNGSNARPSRVRVLIFNDTFNIYESETDSYLAGFPLKGATVNETGNYYYVYADDRQSYLQLHVTNPLVRQIASELENKNRNIISRLLRHRASAFFLVALAFIVGIYFGIISLVPYLGSKLISTDTEIKIGRNLRELMLKQELAMGGKIDSAGSAELQQFADKLRLSHKYPLHITLIRNNTVNAYALPGGEIVVYSGILEKMSSYETLVALLAHESSHINHRHTLRTLLRSTANSIIISVVFGDVAGVSATIAGNVENLTGLRYSRLLEAEADEEGMKLMLANKVDVNGMKNLMELLKKEADMPGSLAFLSTHPLTADRIKNADAFIGSHAGPAENHDDLRRIFESLKRSK